MVLSTASFITMQLIGLWGTPGWWLKILACHVYIVMVGTYCHNLQKKLKEDGAWENLSVVCMRAFLV